MSWSRGSCTRFSNRPPSRYQPSPCKPASSSGDEGCWELLLWFMWWPRPFDNEATLSCRDVIGERGRTPNWALTFDDYKRLRPSMDVATSVCFSFLFKWQQPWLDPLSFWRSRLCPINAIKLRQTPHFEGPCIGLLWYNCAFQPLNQASDSFAFKVHRWVTIQCRGQCQFSNSLPSVQSYCFYEETVSQISSSMYT
jgi:hypothetical protein